MLECRVVGSLLDGRCWRVFALALLALLATGCAHSPAPALRSEPAHFDRAAWLDDFATLLAEMDAHYANLDFAVTTRRMDLPSVRETTIERLRKARTTEQAQAALRAFLKAFGDGHLTIDWPVKPSADVDVAPSGPLCARLGYERAPVGGVDFTSVAGFTPLAPEGDDDFPGGLVHLASGRTWGTLRISLFMETVHPRLCEVARRALALGDDAACDDACEERLQTAVANLLTAALERRLAQLARAGASAILVDITHNGGGSDWVDPATRALTPRPIGTFRTAVVRHEHWTKQLGDRLHEIEGDLAAYGDLPHGELARAVVTLRRTA